LLTWSRAFAANGPMPSQPYLPGDHPPFLLRGAAWLPRCLIPPDAVNLAVLRRHAALELKRKTPARPMLANAAWLPKMGALRLATLMLPFAVNGAPSRRSARAEAYAPAQLSPFAANVGSRRPRFLPQKARGASVARSVSAASLYDLPWAASKISLAPSCSHPWPVRTPRSTMPTQSPATIRSLMPFRQQIITCNRYPLLRPLHIPMADVNRTSEGLSAESRSLADCICRNDHRGGES
jgi:hypothetical protein